MWYDIVCVVILALAAWRGMIKGFVWQLAWIAGIVLCFFFAETVSIAVAPMIGLEPPLSRWVSILGLYIVSSFAAFAMARTIQTGLEKAKFEDYDRHLGALFGFIKGVAICLVLSFFMFTLTEKTRETLVHSRAGYGSAVVFHNISPVMPAELHKILDPYLEGFDPESIVKHRDEHPEGEHSHDHDDETDHSTLDPANPFASSADIQQMISQIPGVFGKELEQIVYQTIEQTAPEDRPELMEKLSTGLPGLIRQVADQWKNGKPAAETPTSTTSTDWKQYRAQLLREIAGVYTEHLEAQQAIMEEVVYALHGVPDAITVAVLEDWRADLRGTQPDPDPTTKLSSSLDQRIVNQLAKANISVSSLPADIRERLTATARNYR